MIHWLASIAWWKWVLFYFEVGGAACLIGWWWDERRTIKIKRNKRDFD